jgi:hypothetical protein
MHNPLLVCVNPHPSLVIENLAEEILDPEQHRLAVIIEVNRGDTSTRALPPLMSRKFCWKIPGPGGGGSDSSYPAPGQLDRSPTDCRMTVPTTCGLAGVLQHSR